MAAYQKQSWGAAGKLRDLDYVNPRQKIPSSALPPEVRRRLGLPEEGERGRPRGKVGNTGAAAASAEHEAHDCVYLGAMNSEPKVGKSGAGTNWQNPNGHAFVRKGSGIPMSHRASRKAQLGGNTGGYSKAGSSNAGSSNAGYSS